jgi:hypothetical protein
MLAQVRERGFAGKKLGWKDERKPPQIEDCGG